MSLPTVRIIFIAEPPLTTAIFMTYFLRNSYGAVVQMEVDNGLKIHTGWVRIPPALFNTYIGRYASG